MGLSSRIDRRVGRDVARFIAVYLAYFRVLDRICTSCMELLSWIVAVVFGMIVVGGYRLL